jgi:hypothetical protein
VCGFFWEAWNFYSYPKWVYHVPFVSWLKLFEMPLLGYGGYLPFALEVLCPLPSPGKPVRAEPPAGLPADCRVTMVVAETATRYPLARTEGAR